MSPEILTAALSGIAVVVLATVLLKSSMAESIAGAGQQLKTALDQPRGFAWGVSLCGLFYLTLQTVYSLRMPLADDEFAGAKAVYEVTQLIPYRDFMPYKTVMGYYIQSLPLFLTDNLWASILLIRVEMAVINSLVLVFVAFRLRRHFSGSAVCFGLAMLVVVSTFVERSYVLRVDMLGSLFGLLTLVFLLERRPVLAGLLAGFGFLVSQKNAYFMVAGGAALGGWWLWKLWRGYRGPEEERGPDEEPQRPTRQAFFDAAVYSATALGVLAAYFAFFSYIGSIDRAVVGVIEKSADIAFTDRPFVCGREFWWQTLRRNPGFYGTAGLALISLAVTVWRRGRGGSLHGSKGWRDWLLLIYGSAMLALSIWHKQPCPYFFVILIPTLSVLIIDLFNRLRETTLRWPAQWRTIVILLYLGVGLAVPLSRLPNTLERDNGFQGHVVALADRLLGPGEGYLATLPILYDRQQAVKEFRWLDDIRRRRLHRANRQEMLDLLSRMDEARIKLIIMNYRMQDLPEPVKDYFVYHFAKFWGNVFLYAPYVGKNQHDFHLDFDGLYQVDLRGKPGPATIDGQPASHGQLLRLAAGSHVKGSKEGIRLRFMPEDLDPTLLEERYREPRDMFGFSFHY